MIINTDSLDASKREIHWYSKHFLNEVFGEFDVSPDDMDAEFYISILKHDGDMLNYGLDNYYTHQIRVTTLEKCNNHDDMYPLLNRIHTALTEITRLYRYRQSNHFVSTVGVYYEINDFLLAYTEYVEA